MLELLPVLLPDLMFFCPQLWPGILSTKVCLLVEVLMVLCSSGTLGKGSWSQSGLMCSFAGSSGDSCAFQGGEGSWRDGDGS